MEGGARKVGGAGRSEAGVRRRVVDESGRSCGRRLGWEVGWVTCGATAELVRRGRDGARRGETGRSRGKEVRDPAAVRVRRDWPTHGEVRRAEARRHRASGVRWSGEAEGEPPLPQCNGEAEASLPTTPEQPVVTQPRRRSGLDFGCEALNLTTRPGFTRLAFERPRKASQGPRSQAPIAIVVKRR